VPILYSLSYIYVVFLYVWAQQYNLTKKAICKTEDAKVHLVVLCIMGMPISYNLSSYDAN